jgi:hypothetical protein
VQEATAEVTKYASFNWGGENWAVHIQGRNVELVCSEIENGMEIAFKAMPYSLVKVIHRLLDDAATNAAGEARQAIWRGLGVGDEVMFMDGSRRRTGTVTDVHDIIYDGEVYGSEIDLNYRLKSGQMRSKRIRDLDIIDPEALDSSTIYSMYRDAMRNCDADDDSGEA